MKFLVQPTWYVVACRCISEEVKVVILPLTKHCARNKKRLGVPGVKYRCSRLYKGEVAVQRLDTHTALLLRG